MRREDEQIPPRRVLHTAYEAARAALPDHRHKYSPKKFTQPQLLACLVLKEFLRVDYRGLAAHLADHPALCWSIGLKAVPHYTTFQKAAARLLAVRPGRLMFDAVLERARKDGTRRRRVRLAAVDGTGLESRHVSRYFSRRAGRAYSHFPKVVFVVDCGSHMILSDATGARAGLGPGAIPAGVRPGDRAGEDRGAAGRRRLRRRMGPRGRPVAGRADEPPAAAGGG